MKQSKVEYLVVDSGAFIKNPPIYEYGENILTTQGVVMEIKDKATRQRLEFLPYKLKFQEPSQEIIKYVTEFSKKTGDYPSLSAVDIQIIALTYQLEKENVGIDHLNKEPVRGKVTAQPAKISKSLLGFYYPDEEEVAESDDPVVAGADSKEETHDSDDYTRLEEDRVVTGAGSKEETRYSNDYTGLEEDRVATDADRKKETCDSDDCTGLEEDRSSVEEDPDPDLTDCNNVSEDSEHWITPFNIDEVKQKMGMMSVIDESTSVAVACITTDFAIQNVLLQMGLHVISVDGMLIKHTKVFMLRCYACYRTTNIMTKQFCPSCGNKTLKRVAVSVNEDGSKKIHINFKKPINIRGTKYSLPIPRGGKHAQNPVLCEDQPVAQNKPCKSALTKIDMFCPEYEVRSSPFSINDVYSRAAQLGIRKAKSTVTRKNPNEPVRRIGKKKNNKKM